jgi:hypothetical protein
VKLTRGTSIATGALFIVATIAALAAAAVQPVLTGTNYLTGVANQPNRLAAAAVLCLIAAGTSVGIAIALYPLLKEVNAALAMGSVVFRTIEAVFYTVAVVCLLSLVPLSQQLATEPDLNLAPIQVIGDTLLNIRDHSNVAAIFAFSVAAVMYYTLFYRSRLVPRWLAGWGVAGALLMMTAGLLALVSNRDVTGYTFLILPTLVQELVLAVWLLVKGFRLSPLTSAASSESPTTQRQS